MKVGLDTAVEKILEYEMTAIPRLYATWLGLSLGKKGRIKASIRRIIQAEVLGEAFTQALAEDVFKDGEIDVRSAVFQYIKKKLYRGDSRKCLMDLQSRRAR